MRRPVKGDAVRVPTSVCPHCRMTLDAVSTIGDLYRPRPGDLYRPRPGDATVCIYCAGVAVFGDRLRLRIPTTRELAEIAANPDMQRDIARIKRAVDAVRRERDH